MPTRNEIARKQRQKMLDAFQSAVQDIKDEATIKDIQARIDEGDIDGVLRLLGLREGAFEPMAEAIRVAYREGGKKGAEQIGSIPSEQGEIAFRFDGTSPNAQRWVQEESSRLIAEVLEDQKAMVRERLAQALEDGRNPRRSALDLVGRLDQRTGKRVGGFIGTTQRQAEWIEKARAEMESLDSNYLRRELRDRRFDKVMKEAIESGEPLNEETINKAVTQMQANTQRYRAENISRTESITALRAGQHQSVQQAVEEGEITEEDATKVWDATSGPRTRPDHNEMDGQRKPLNQPFVAPDGSQLRYPGDRSLGAPPEQVINCRCRERTEVDFAGEVRRVEGFDPP